MKTVDSRFFEVFEFLAVQLQKITAKTARMRKEAQG
jgi:hypothetical protein